MTMEPAPFAKLTATTATPDMGQFGFQVRMSGNLMVAGAWPENYFLGAAYVFEMDESSEWSQVARLQPDDVLQGSGFGSSVDIHEETVIVGRIEHNFGDATSGTAFVYKRTPEGFVQTAKLTASDDTTADYFGAGVAVYGDSAVVGAPYDSNEGFVGSGAVYVFRTFDDGWTWTQQTKLTAAVPGANRHFGFQLSLGADFLAIGATDRDILQASSYTSGNGAAFVHNTTSWAHVATLEASDGDWGDEYGKGLAVRGDIVVVGAPRAGLVGAAYVYDTSTWAQVTKLVPSDPAPNTHFGRTVCIGADVIAIGANVVGVPEGDPGSVELFDLNSTNRIGTVTTTAMNDFGNFLAIGDNGVLLVSAINAGNMSGAIYAFDVHDAFLPVAAGKSGGGSSNTYHKLPDFLIMSLLGLVALLCIGVLLCCICRYRQQLRFSEREEIDDVQLKKRELKKRERRERSRERRFGEFKDVGLYPFRDIPIPMPPPSETSSC